MVLYRNCEPDRHYLNEINKMLQSYTLMRGQIYQHGVSASIASC